jgi:putative phage-type endonuclease
VGKVGIAVTTTALAASHARAAWLAERRSGIGGSDIAAIAGISPWASPWSKWADKVGLLPDRDVAEWSPSMRLGVELERAIGNEFTIDTGLHVAGEQTLVRHRRFPHHFATVDAFVLDSEESEIGDALGVFEAKFTNETWDAVPAHYLAQVQWQLHCTGLQLAWVGVAQSAFGRLHYKTFTIERDATRQIELVEVAETFWNDYVITGTPPPADDHRATTETITALWGGVPTVREPTVDFSGERMREILVELRDFKRQIAALSALVERRENSVKAHFGRAAELKDLLVSDLSEGFVDDELAVSWRSQERTDIDTKAVRAEHGDRYDRTKVIRVLRLHGSHR